MRFLFVVLICIAASGFISCGHKAAYSNLNTSREVKEANENGGQPDSATAGAQNQPAAAAPTEPFKPPKFMVNGQAKDLPNYPHAITKTMQFGPVQGVDTMSLVLETRDPFDQITAFYEKAIKSNGWTIENQSVNPEQAEWSLKKTFDNEGKVQVVKNPQTKAFNIVIVRTEKISQ